MARVTTVKTSINSNASESPNIDSTSWSTDNGTITLNSDLSASINVGDVITDSATNSYLITDVSGAVLTCQDFDTTTDPVTGAATISEAYATITLWEADLDAGTNAEVYKSGDDAQGELYGTVDEDFTYIGGSTIGLAGKKLTVPEAERHDGTAGSGAGIVRISGSANVIVTLGVPDVASSIEWLEIDASDNGVSSELILREGGTATVWTINNVILHNIQDTPNCDGIIVLSGATDILNTLIYSIDNNGGNNATGKGITDNTGNVVRILNSTIHDIICRSNNGDATCVESSAGNVLQNVIATDPFSTNNDEFCYTGTPATEDHNLASDTTASGTGSLNNKTSADQFVSNSAPYDLHLKTGADAIDAGTDLGVSPSGVEIDIDGRDRDAEGDTWDMGADEFIGAPPSFQAAWSDKINQYIGLGV